MQKYTFITKILVYKLRQLYKKGKCYKFNLLAPLMIAFPAKNIFYFENCDFPFYMTQSYVTKNTRTIMMQKMLTKDIHIN